MWRSDILTREGVSAYPKNGGFNKSRRTQTKLINYLWKEQKKRWFEYRNHFMEKVWFLYRIPLIDFIRIRCIHIPHLLLVQTCWDRGIWPKGLGNGYYWVVWQKSISQNSANYRFLVFWITLRESTVKVLKSHKWKFWEPGVTSQKNINHLFLQISLGHICYVSSIYFDSFKSNSK